METPLTSQKVMVTGAYGFIGAHLIRRLSSLGNEVTALVRAGRSQSRQKDALPGVRVVEVAGETGLVRAFRESGAQYVIHLDATMTTERSLVALEETLRGNLLPTMALMTECVDRGVKRLVLMGSGEEYGRGQTPFGDHTVLNPPSPYGASKAATTAYARMFHNAFHLPVTVLRPSVIYGPEQTPRMLISQVMHALREGREIAVTGGMQTRDFVYIDDVISGIVQALTAEGIDGRSWNVASGEVVTVRECLERIEGITGAKGLIQFGARPYAENEIFDYVYDVEESAAQIGWRATTPLDVGLLATWKYWQSKPAHTE